MVTPRRAAHRLRCPESSKENSASCNNNARYDTTTTAAVPPPRIYSEDDARSLCHETLLNALDMSDKEHFSVAVVEPMENAAAKEKAKEEEEEEEKGEIPL